MAGPVNRIPAPVTGAPRRFRCLAIALAAGAGLVLALPVVLVGSATPAAGHSELILSVPAAGSVGPVSPTAISLVFSEPIEPRYSSLDLLDGAGRTLLAGVGAQDPTDPDVLTVGLAVPLADGTYTVNWRVSSAADGHDTTGYLVFGVGSVSLVGQTHSATGNGSLHAGQDSAHAAAEIQGKAAGYGGAMVAFGLAVIALLVLLPGRGRVPRGTAYGAGIGLVVAAGGCFILIVVGATSVTTAGGSQPDYLGYATGGRAGVLLTARLLIALLGGAIAIGLARRGQPARALVVGGLAASAEIGLIAAGGHAAAFSSPLPVVVDIVHVGAASIWLAGLVALGALTDFGGHTRLAPAVLRDVVRRFSALALVSIALITATGVYAAWIEIGDFSAIHSAYDVNLVVKIGVFVLAVAVGALNYFDGGRDRRWLGGLSKRLLLELCLAIAVVVIAANLTSGSPTGTDRPVAIGSSASAPSAFEPAELGIQPGRPGPNRYMVSLAGIPSAPLTLALHLVRVDAGPGSATIPLQADPSDLSGRAWASDVDQLPAGSQWTATVVISGSNGAELSREQFSFALDAAGISAGRAAPPIDPILVVALMLLLGGLFGVGFTLAGKALPRTLRETSRVAVLGGSLVGGVLGIALLIGGTPR